MKHILFLLTTFLVFNCSKTNGQTEKHIISSDELKDMVTYLASDDIKGRQTGSDGIEASAQFIEEQFKSYGVKPYYETYRDEFSVRELEAFNVIGYLEGNDPKLKEEIVIIGAHYDHIGMGKPVENDSIANGANDNATGTAAVMALAKYLAKEDNNKRSVMFALFTAEEMGLKGSQNLAKRLSKEEANIYTVINLEMVGVPLIDKDHLVFLTGYEHSNMAENINAALGEKIVGESEVSKKYKLFMRSDNYPFYQEMKIPSHTLSSCDLTNFDQYHKVGDEVELLDFKFMAHLVNTLAPAIEHISNAEAQEIQLYEEN